MTSNIGAQYIDRMQSIGFNASVNSEGSEIKGISENARDRENYENSKQKVMEALKDHFRPEFLNRIDEIVLFDILSPEAIKNIVDIELQKVRARLLDKEITLELSDEVLSYLAKEGYDPHYGARPLKRLIQNKILTPMASLIISEGISKGATVSVSVKKPAKESKDNKAGIKITGKNQDESGLIKSPIRSIGFGVGSLGDVKSSYMREGGAQAHVEFIFEVKKGKKNTSHTVAVEVGNDKADSTESDSVGQDNSNSVRNNSKTKTAKVK